MFKAAELSKDLSATNSFIECSIWIVSVIMHTAFNNRRKKSSDVNVDTDLVSIAWKQMFCHKWKEVGL